MSLTKDIMKTLDTRKENHLDVRPPNYFAIIFNSGDSSKNIQQCTMRRVRA